MKRLDATHFIEVWSLYGQSVSHGPHKISNLFKIINHTKYFGHETIAIFKIKFK